MRRGAVGDVDELHHRICPRQRAIDRVLCREHPLRQTLADNHNLLAVMEDAALYQALHRLEEKGLIEAEWGVSENNRRAKYYALTAAGRRQLRTEVATWKQYTAALLKVIEEPA